MKKIEKNVFTGIFAEFKSDSELYTKRSECNQETGLSL
jgi:hypothetical protein